jgi:hypothetical protein
MSVFFLYYFRRADISDNMAIKNCIDGTHDSIGELTIVLDGADWRLEEAVLLPSDTTVIIDGCSIIQNDGAFDNVFRGDNLVLNPDDPFGRPLSVKQTGNIRIIGRNNAQIIGCEINRRAYHPVLNETQDMTGDFWGWRTLQICLSKCDGFEVGGISFSRTRCWAMSFDLCSNGYVHDIHFETRVKNGDGVNFRAGTHHCRVERITGFTSDDTVACTALRMPDKEYPVRNYIYPLEPAISIYKGDAGFLDIHDIQIDDVKTGGRCHGVICLAAEGLQVRHIRISNVDEADEGEREAAVKIYTGYGGGYRDGDLHHIEVSGVTSRISSHAVLCNAKMEHIRLRGIRQEKPGARRVTLAYADNVTED